MILGIDPSYTGFGVALMSEEAGSLRLIKSDRFVSPSKIYEKFSDIHDNCRYLVDRLYEFVNDVDLSSTPSVIIEYPALQTISGSYLAVLNGYIGSLFRGQKICWVPPTAVDSFVKNKQHSKTFLVEYCKNKEYISKRTSHDICTAIILCELLVSIKQGLYKNKYFWNNEKIS